MQPRSLFKTILVVPFLALAACGGDDSAANSGTPHFQRSFVEPAIAVNNKGNKIKAANVGSQTLSSMLLCEDPAMETRLDSKAYIMGYQRVDRSKQGYQYPVAVRAKQIHYETETSGQLYNSHFRLIELSLDGASAIANGTYAFTDTCTLESGCDKEKRIYTEGSAWAKVSIETRMKQMSSNIQDEIEPYNCTYGPAPEIGEAESSIREVKVGIFGKARLAAEYLYEEPVVISCQGEEVGHGTLVKREIVLADRLPRLSEFNTTTIGARTIGCARTQVFRGEQVRFNGQTLEGSASELSQYNVEGEIRSVEEWKQDKNNYLQTKAELENAISVAESRVNQARATVDVAKSKVAQKKRELSEANEQEQLAENKLNNLKNDPEATPQQINQAQQDLVDKSVLVQKIELTLEDARDELSAAENSYDSAQVALRDARSALSQFLAENPDPS